jgi:hypothetical protein
MQNKYIFYLRGVSHTLAFRSSNVIWQIAVETSYVQRTEANVKTSSAELT